MPPAPETLKAIRDLVAGVSGFTPDRGDQLIVEALPFESTLNPELPAAGPALPASSGIPLPSWLQALRDPKLLIGAALLLVVGAGLAFVLRRKGKPAARAAGPTAIAAAAARVQGGPSIEEQMKARLEEQANLQDRLDQEALNSLKMPKVNTKKTEVLVKQVKENAKKDASLGAHVLCTWIAEQDKN